jgi:hypothetical protein
MLMDGVKRGGEGAGSGRLGRIVAG